LLSAPLVGQDFFPLDQVRPGMQGVGRTVFAGEKIEEFQVEILGVLENVAPKQSLILARLSGGPLAKTGVMAGMSGSPVYLDGRLAGAVAYSFPFTTEPIAGIRPIAEMIDTLDGPGVPAVAGATGAGSVGTGSAATEALAKFLTPEGRSNLDLALLPAAPDAPSFDPQLVPVATSVGLAGFSERAFEVFGPRLRSLGLHPMQGVGGRSAAANAPVQPLQPGSMISVALIRGDLDVNASGTVTYVEDGRVYAFGHRFLASGPTEMPFARSSVIAVVPNLSNSFKIAGAGDPVGAITADRSTGVSGRLGAEARMLPLAMDVKTGASGAKSYRMELVNDRVLTPFLLQMALYSAADTSERQVGAASLRLTGVVEFANEATPPLRLDNMFSGTSNLPMQAATAAAVPLAYLLQNGFDDLQPRSIRLAMESIEEERRLEIDRAWVSNTSVRAGSEIEIAVALRGPKGSEIIRKTKYQVPAGTPAGPLLITVADADSLNAQEWQLFANPRQAASPDQLIHALNRLRRNDRLYIRIWRPTRGFVLQTERLPAPPASVAGLLSIPSKTGGEVRDEWQSAMAEMELDGFDSVVNGQIHTKVTVVE
jgi:hypothetical protein